METLLAVLVLCAFSCRAPEQADLFSSAGLNLVDVHRAQLDGSGERKVPFGFLIAGHEVAKGEGRVFQFRKKHDSKRGADSAYTEELSVYVPEWTPEELPAGLSDRTSGVIVFYSTFSDAFLGNSGCFGYATIGKLSIKKDGKYWTVTLNSTFARRAPVGFGAHCEDVHIDGSYQAQRQSSIPDTDLGSL